MSRYSTEGEDVKGHAYAFAASFRCLCRVRKIRREQYQPARHRLDMPNSPRSLEAQAPVYRAQDEIARIEPAFRITRRFDVINTAKPAVGMAVRFLPASRRTSR